MRTWLVVLLAVCAWAPAQASADAGSITVDGATATFTVTKTTCGSLFYCGWFALATSRPAAEPCSAEAPVWVGRVREGLITMTGTAPVPEGPQRLCLFVHDGETKLLAELVYPQAAPVPTPTPTAVPPTSLVTTPMPGRIGRTDRTNDRLTIFPGRAPWEIDLDRFVALVRAAARRWDIRTGGVSWRTFRFARPDGRNGIGFAPLRDDTLGETHTWSARVYRPRRVCSRQGCRIARRYVGRQVVERDVALSTRITWQQGPEYPGPDEFDLESVIIHELGHWAGNQHRRSCSNPMLRALDAGDWWRDVDDYHFAHCGARAGGRLRSRRYTVDVTLPARLPDAAAGPFARIAWAHRTGVARARRIGGTLRATAERDAHGR